MDRHFEMDLYNKIEALEKELKQLKEENQNLKYQVRLSQTYQEPIAGSYDYDTRYRSSQG
jgi:predicted RNase H-like nuclease (RuvC/YqgF family)